MTDEERLVIQSFAALSKAHALRMKADEIESHLEWIAKWRRKVKAHV